MQDEKIIFEIDNDKILVPFDTKVLNKPGVWALYGEDDKTGEFICLNVGKSTNVGDEILQDLSRFILLPFMENGTIPYYNQFKEDCGFCYKRDQVQDYLYPFIKLCYTHIKFILISNIDDANIEKEYASKHTALFWRNGRPHVVKQETNYNRQDLQLIDSYFQEGGQTYTLEELLIKLENDLGYDSTASKKLITECVTLGFIYEADENIYTR